MQRAFGVLLVVVALSGCTVASPTVSSHSAPKEKRFPLAEELVLADSAEAQVPTNRLPLPRFPSAERSRGEEAAFVAAFVLDTLGRVESRSVTFVGDAPASFVRTVCAYYKTARFTPVRRDGVARRALIVVPWTFGLQGGRWEKGTINESPVRERLRQEGAVAATAELDSLPHCPPG